MSTLRFFIVFAFPAVAFAAGPNLGQSITAAELSVWNINVMPDGAGLPPGSGTSAKGAPIYAQKCAHCHGEQGKGGVNAAVVGGAPGLPEHQAGRMRQPASQSAS
jgi:cytochrome c